MQPDAGRQPGGQRPLPPLVPHPGHLLAPTAAAATSTPSSSSFTSSRPSGTRKGLTPAACEACRQRKTKCDASRPTCSACVRRSSACQYDTGPEETHARALKRKHDALQSKTSALEELFELLQSSPEKEAVELLGRVRAGDDVESIVKHVRDGDLLLQLALVPEARFRYEFPHVKEMPLFLQTPDNPYVGSVIYELVIDKTTAPQQLQPSPPTRTQAPPDGDGENGSRYLKPFHAAVLVDPVLDSVKPSSWTRVSANDALMRDLIGAYFLREHMWFTYLNKNLFMEGMASGSTDFCSSLLVNALLAFACRCDRRVPKRAEYWNPNNLGYRFLAEAKRLWDLEQHRSKITTIQAALFIHGVNNLDGADAIGWRYASRAVDMARELRLFTSPGSERVSKKMRIAREFTAWALFCWQGVISYLLWRRPVLDAPPAAALPDPTSSPQWYGDFLIKYPLDQVPTSARHGHDFKARAELITILNEIASEYFTSPSSPPDCRRSMESVLRFYAKLKAWFDALPEPLTAKKIVLPSQLKLQSVVNLVVFFVDGDSSRSFVTRPSWEKWLENLLRCLMSYYIVLINLFKPWVDLEPGDPCHAAFVREVRQTPKHAVHSATRFMETLFRVYYLRHSFEFMDAYLLQFLNVLGFMSLEELKASTESPIANDRRCLLLMCALGLREQGQYYYLVRTIYHLFRSSMTREDARLLSLYAQDSNPEKDVLYRTEELISDYPLNIISISDDPSKHRITYLVNDIQNVSLEN